MRLASPLVTRRTILANARRSGAGPVACPPLRAPQNTTSAEETPTLAVQTYAERR